MKKELLLILIAFILVISGCQNIIGTDIGSGGKDEVSSYRLTGDFDSDNCITEVDANLLSEELKNPEESRNLFFDVNKDSIVNSDDFLALADNFGVCACSKDGTLSGQCSTSPIYGQPFFCSSGLELEGNCFNCGCPENERCAASGYCEKDLDGVRLYVSTEKDTYLTGEKIEFLSEFKITLGTEVIDVVRSIPIFYKNYQSQIIQTVGGQYVKRPIKNAFDGYIVIFNEPSVIQARDNYLRLKAKRIGEASTLNDELMTHFNSLRRAHNSVLGMNERTDALTGYQIRRELIIKSEYFSLLNGAWVDGPESEIQRIKDSPLVKSVTPSYLYYPILYRSVPNINANNVASKDGSDFLTGRGVRVAVLDTGIDYTHKDFGGCTKDQVETESCLKVYDSYNLIDEDNNILDANGHGTHVASIIAGNGEIKGVAPEASLMIYKVCDDYGGCPEGAILAGLERAIDPNQDFQYEDRADVISMSLGGLASNPPEDDIFYLSVDNAISAGSVVVIAAGNNGPGKGTIGSPGSLQKAITVGALCLPEQIWNNEYCKTEYPYIAEFSSRGPSFVNDKPDIVAPGVDICAAKSSRVSGDDFEECIDNEHITLSGTSMATPHVSGAVALIKQEHPEWNYLKVKNALKYTATDLGYPRYIQGSGLINVRNALNFDKEYNLEITAVGGGYYDYVEVEDEGD